MYILALNILNMCDDESNQHVEFIGSNVFLGNSKENWDEKLSVVSKDGQIVCYPSRCTLLLGFDYHLFYVCFMTYL